MQEFMKVTVGLGDRISLVDNVQKLAGAGLLENN